MIILIAAIGEKNELGKDNGLIWQIPKDLKFFKEKTNGATIAMGKKTFNSLPKILPGRHHLVLSSKGDFNKEINENVEVFSDKDEFIKRCKKIAKENNLFVIGGGMLYELFMPVADKLIITHIYDTDKDADTFFPEIDSEIWAKRIIDTDEENGIGFSHVEYNKR